MLAVDLYEPNNSFAQSSNLGQLTTVVGDLTIEGPGDTDHFTWTAPTAGTLRVDITFDHEQGDLDLRLYSGNLSEIDASITANNAERVSTPVAAGQVFYFRVSELTGQLTNSYHLALHLIEPDAIDAVTPNNTRLTAHNLGSADNVLIEDLSIHNAADQDFFRWVAPRSGLVTVDATFSQFQGDLALQLQDVNGFVLTSADDLNDNERMTYNVISGTTYFIRVREALGDVHPEYSLSLDLNSPPTITDIQSTPGYMGGITNIPFTISDVESPLNTLTLTATSGFVGLVPNSNITFSGTGANRIMHIQALPGFGTVPITVRVTDQEGAFAQDTFDLFLFLNNSAPTITDISDQAILESSSTGPLAFIVGDAETPLNQLSITAVSSNQSLIPDANLILGGSGANRTIQITPIPGLFGSSVVTLTVADLNGRQVQDSIVVFVTPVNDPPTISAINDQTIVEDGATGSLAFTLADPDTPVGSLTVTGTSNNVAIIPNGNIAISGTGANRTVVVTPLPNAAGGPVQITLTVSDGQLIATELFNVTVQPVNDLPTVSNIGNQLTNEDTPTAAIPFVVGDLETSAAVLNVSATSSNLSLVPNAGIAISGAGANRTLVITPAANASGTTTITVTVADENGGIATDTFDLTVSAVNDNPTISDIANQSTNEDTPTAAIPFTVGDLESAVGTLTVSVASDNPALLPNANIVLGGSGANRTVTLTPVANATGSATVTVTVTDENGGSASDTFNLTVVATNDAPTISDITNQTTNEDVATSAIAFTVGDVEDAAAALVVSAVSSNTALVPNANLVFGGTGANRTLTITPAPNANGTTTITVTVTDSAGGTSTDTFDLTVNPVNDVPTISDIANQATTEDTAINGIGFTVGDLETAAASLTVSASSDNPTLIPSGNLVLGGSGANRTISITPAANASGTANITVSVNDGNGGITTDTFLVTVSAVNDLPTISDIGNQSTNEDTPTAAIPLTVGDVETAAASLVVTATSSNLTLVPNANLVLGGSGANRTITITPAAGESGNATITVQVDDGNGGLATDTFVLSVGSVDDPPAITPVADANTNEDSALGPIAITLSDPDTPLSSLTLTATSSNQAIIPNGNLILGGSNGNRTLTVTPAANANGGPVTITLTASDGTTQVQDAFLVTVVSVNDLPTISDITNLTTSEDATGLVNFTVGDVETSAGDLVITATSSNAALVPNANLVIGGSGANRSLTLTPLANQFGTATITVVVSDGNGGTATDTFELTVTSANDLPTITDIVNQSINEDGSASVSFSIGDIETAAADLVVTATSSNAALIPNANLVLGGTGANRTLTLNPLANQFGTATISVVVTDANGGTTTDTFNLTVASVNDLPTISDIANQSVNEDGSASVNFTVGDLETAAANLVITATSSNGALVPNANIVVGGSGANRTLTVTPLANQSGTATISVEVKDADGGTVTDTFEMTVVAVNDLPTISDVANQSINEDGVASISLTIGDIETPVADLVVTATSSNAALIPNGAIVVGGAGANRTLSITPLANQFGTATISVEVKDANGATAVDTFELTVVSVNDLPTLGDIANQSINEDTQASVGFVVGDVETAAADLTVVATSSNAALVPNANLVVSGTGANRTLTVTPVSNQFGTATISVVVTDAAGGTTTDTFELTVVGVNDLPTISNINDQSVNEDSAATVNFTIGDQETAAADLIITTSSSNAALVPNGNIVLGGSGANRSLAITPLANQFGSTTITVEVKDASGAIATDTFTLTVISVNDPPHVSNIADQAIDEDGFVTVNFSIEDFETAATALTVVASSSNTSLIPNANLVLAGTGSNRTITITPAANQTGNGNVSIEVTDSQGGKTTRTFGVVVADIGDRPTISAIDDVTVRSGRSTGPLAFSVGDVDTPVGNLIVTATSNQPGFITGITLDGTGANRQVTVNTKSGQPAGVAEITLTVSDGQSSSSETFNVNVLPAVLGDANNDGIFDSDDLLAVFQAGEYDDAIEDNSVWETGDWNGDGDFDSGDLLAAFQAGTYSSQGLPARASVAAIQANHVDQALALSSLWEE